MSSEDTGWLLAKVFGVILSILLANSIYESIRFQVINEINESSSTSLELDYQE